MNGCFWHGHEGCKYFVWPKNNADFWKKKIEDNISRDKNVIEMLKRQNWSVIVVWECELKKQTLSRTLQKVNELILGNRP